MPGDEVENLEAVLHYRFQNRSLCRTALTHSSYTGAKNYERLEFLGDRVLGLVIAEALYQRFPNEPEGDLAKRLSALVQGPFLAKIAQKIDLGRYIILSSSERSAGNQNNPNILSDIVESLIGAMYLDGGLAPCKTFIETLWGDSFDEMKAPPQHPKTALQEWAQGQAMALPVYELMKQDGPDHAPVFYVKLTVGGYPPLEAHGRTRQAAEKEAAQQFLERRIKP